MITNKKTECDFEETQGNYFISYPIPYKEPRKHLT